MDYQTYVDKTTLANEKFEANDMDAAYTLFEELIHSDLSDIDKSFMSNNLAQVCNKSGDTENALAWFDYGIALETPYYRYLVREYKAAFLAEKRRDAEALAIYEDLYQQPYVIEADKERIWKNIIVLRNPRP